MSDQLDLFAREVVGDWPAGMPADPAAERPEPGPGDCVACGGTGKSSRGWDCESCHGTGKRTE